MIPLKWWTNLPNKKEVMKEHNIKTITYAEIVKLYANVKVYK